jgi:hypothetical protein
MPPSVRHAPVGGVTKCKTALRKNPEGRLKSGAPENIGTRNLLCTALSMHTNFNLRRPMLADPRRLPPRAIPAELTNLLSLEPL